MYTLLVALISLNVILSLVPKSVSLFSMLATFGQYSLINQLKKEGWDLFFSTSYFRFTARPLSVFLSGWICVLFSLLLLLEYFG